MIYYVNYDPAFVNQIAPLPCLVMLAASDSMKLIRDKTNRQATNYKERGRKDSCCDKFKRL